MILMDAVQVWSRITGKPIKEYFSGIKIDKRLDRDTLVNLIFMEFGQLDTLDSDTSTFKSRMEYFFLIHEYNITKLLDSMYYDYNPLTTVDMRYNRKSHFDQFDDENKTDTRDLRSTFWENFIEDEITDVDSSTDTTNNNTYNEENRNHKENSATSNETDMHFVSAYNKYGAIGDPDAINQSGDVEKSRDTIRASSDASEDANGNKSGNVNDIGTEVHNQDTDRDREYTKTNESTDNEKKIGNRTNDMDRDEEENRTEYGNNGRFPYQQLIEKERELAEINIYKWVIRHMAKELFVGVY